MNADQDNHLDYDQLLRAVVDRADLNAIDQAHLDQCEQCRHQVGQLRGRFSQIGRMARQLSPESKQAFRLPQGRLVSRPRRLKPALMMGVTAAMVLVLMWWPKIYGPSQAPTVAPVAQEVENDDPLIEQVDALVADALPEDYRAVVAVAEPEEDNDMMNFIVPFERDEPSAMPSAG